MDLMKTDYEFLDLSDVKEAELNSLQSALYERIPDVSGTRFAGGWKESTTDQCTCSSSSVGAGTVSSSVDSLSGGECEMAPHSPARASAAQPHTPHGHHAPHGPPPPYAQPPPAYPPPHHNHHWPVAPPNVYVSQVTANVNVHGYMGQYYQPPQPQYTPAPAERTARAPRRERRGKRAPSPPQQPPPYYLQYPQYYPAAQAQGAPLYHLPVYQPLVYGPYAYPPYYPEYPLPLEGDPDKGPEEYPQEVVMEQEAVDAYYANAHYGAPSYGPPVDGAVEYIPPMYLPPPPHPPPLPISQPPPPQTTPHQFNVHAKNFVQGQSQNKTYTPPDKPQEHKAPQPTSISSASTGSVESLPMKDLKISKGPSSPKQGDRTVEPALSKPSSPSEKAPVVMTKSDSIKTTWISAETKVEVAVASQSPVTKTFPVAATAVNQTPVSKIPATTAGKPSKGPTAPFSGNKQPVKPTVPQTIVPVQQAATTSKAPFGSRQKRDGPSNRSPSNENNENAERVLSVIEHAKREPPLPPSKAPMPISITLQSAGPPLIVTNKSPFGHSRKNVTAPEPPPVPQPPPPAPTASDFPPPPTPRNRGEPAPPPVVAPQPQPAPGKSWASLFSNKNNVPAVTAAPVPVHTAVASVVVPEEPPSPTAATPPAIPNVQKPVAKVPPFDASPSLAPATDKMSPTPRPATVAASPAISYSEKTSVNATTGGARAAPMVNEVREVPVQKEASPTAPVQPSPFSDDPNSYRMGEFLSKYQLDNRPVALLPRGLTNRSNYCYVNAILQALIACPPFYNMLKALPYQTRRGKSSTPVIDSLVELCYEFSPLTSAGRVGRGGAASSGPAPAVPAGPPLEGGAGLRVLRSLRPFPGSQEGRQEDAEEFLGCLLNSLNDEMLELMKLVEPEETVVTGSTASTGVPEEDDDEWKVMGPRNRGAVERRWAARRTPVADIFRGRTRLRLTRAAHHDVTDAVQPFFTLQLDIERASSVKDALELLAGKDSLEGVSDAWQQLSLEQLPVVLLLHLKCFQLDAEGHTAKIVKNIDFSIDLKIDPKIMSSKLKYTTKQRVYKLFAVVYHEGVEAVKGHYLTDTFHGQVGWIRYDDSTVSVVGENAVLKPKAPRMPYLLMYRRHDTLPAHRSQPAKLD